MNRRANCLNRIRSDFKAMLPGLVLCALFLAFSSAVFGKVCPVRLLLGIPCPACGMTRAAVFLITGDLSGSLKANPFLLPLIASLPIYIWEHYWKNQRARLFSGYIAVLILFMVLFYLYRMAVYFPNEEPMVYEPDNLFHGLRQLTALLSAK